MRSRHSGCGRPHEQADRRTARDRRRHCQRNTASRSTSAQRRQDSRYQGSDHASGHLRLGRRGMMHTLRLIVGCASRPDIQRILTSYSDNVATGRSCAHCHAHRQPCSRHTSGQHPLRTNWPERLTKSDYSGPSPETPEVARAQMRLRRMRASRWLRERAKRKGMKGLVAALRRVA